MTKTHFDVRLLDKPAYLQHLADAIGRTKRGDRVAVASFTFEPEEPPIARLVSELCAAAQRGVQVSLAVDAYIFLLHGRRKTPGPWWFNMQAKPPLHGVFRERLAAIEVLRNSGVVVGITNQPARRFSTPQRGRSHIKAAVVNDQVYVGGCNLSDFRLDLMLQWHDSDTADWLYPHLCAMATLERTSEAFDGQDWAQPVQGGAMLLVDAGLPERSIILDRSLELIDTAQRWIFIASQYFPHGLTGQHLQRARQRGVTVYTMHNHPSQHGLAEGSLLHLVLLRERTRLPRSAFAGQLAKQQHYLHAKVLATEQGAIVGSHNYVPTGTKFGTAEIALQVQEAAFAHDAVTFIAKLTGLQADPQLAALLSRPKL